MTKFHGGQNPLSYMGVRAVAPPDVIVASRAPTTSDRRYKIGTWWINNSADDAYVLTSVSSGSATWLAAAAGPFAVASVTANSMLYGNGTGAIQEMTVGTNGQVVVGSTGAAPAFATLTSTDSSVTYATGANTLDISVTQATTSQLGGGETATDAEAQAKTSTAVLVTPSNLAAEGFMQWADVSLTATQIKALTTPFQLVATQGAGTFIKFLGAVFKLNAGSEVLTESGDNLGIKYTDASGVQVSQTIESTGFIDQAVDTYTNAEPAIDAIVAASAAEAAPLVLDNLGSNFAGNASDDATLDVRVYYTVQSL